MEHPDVPFACGTVTYSWVCAFCQKCYEETHSFTPGQEICVPTPPQDWHTLDGIMVCDSHGIQVTPPSAQRQISSAWTRVPGTIQVLP